MLEADQASRAIQHTAKRIDLLIALSSSDLRARYGRGSWKSLKWLLDPFFATGVYLILVTFVINRPGVAPGLSIACATVPFQLVIASVVNGLGSIQLRHSIVLNTRFDRSMIPLAGVVTETIAFGSALVLLAVMMAVYSIATDARHPLASGRDRRHRAVLRLARVSGLADRALVSRPEDVRRLGHAHALLRRPRPRRARPGARPAPRSG